MSLASLAEPNQLANTLSVVDALTDCQLGWPSDLCDNRFVTSDLRAAAAAYRRATKRADELRSKLAEAIIEADRSGMRQVEIVGITGYTRERVRQIIRESEQSG
jgi:hypothetical protein